MSKVKTRTQLRAEITEYRKRAHRTRKYVSLTFPILFRLWKRARREKKDLWGELGVYIDPNNGEKIHGSAFKGAFRDFLSQKQQGRCCYCRCWLVNTPNARPIEHILPKNAYATFSLDFWNLALACVDCNLAKGKQIWGSIPLDTKDYPDQEAFADMYHPRLHLYDSHIRYVAVETNGGGITLYQGLSPQGRHLCLNLLQKIASKRALIDNNSGLKLALSDIDGFRAKMNDTSTPALDAFAQLLDTRLLELLKS